MDARVAVLLVAALALAGGAQASHFGMYSYNAVEHDAQGTSAEPDGLVTSVLGPRLTNCVLELPGATGFAGRCQADPVPRPAGALGSVLAPGCTGDGAAGPERKLDGQCGLWSIGVGAPLPLFAAGGVRVGAQTVPEPITERGMDGSAAPGAYTPTKASVVRFLDGRLTTAVQTGYTPFHMVDTNRKLAEAGRVAGLGLPAGAVLPGEAMVWAWYGQWQDRNGNGVIDHLTPGPGRAANEFAWLGRCIAFSGDFGTRAVQLGLCTEDPNPNSTPPGTRCIDGNPAGEYGGCAHTTIDAWFFPGHHHGSFPAPPPDFPGQQVVNWAVFECAEYEGGCDAVDEQYNGDPLLGTQAALVPDTYFHDMTGDPDDAQRFWPAANGWTMWFYGDDGLLVTLVQVTGVNCARTGGPNGLDLATPAGQPGGCTFLDVDRLAAVSPDAERLLVGDPEAPTGGLKGLARGAWLLVRDARL